MAHKDLISNETGIELLVGTGAIETCLQSPTEEGEFTGQGIAGRKPPKGTEKDSRKKSKTQLGGQGGNAFCTESIGRDVKKEGKGKKGSKTPAKGNPPQKCSGIKKSKKRKWG